MNYVNGSKKKESKRERKRDLKNNCFWFGVLTFPRAIPKYKDGKSSMCICWEALEAFKQKASLCNFSQCNLSLLSFQQ